MGKERTVIITESGVQIQTLNFGEKIGLAMFRVLSLRAHVRSSGRRLTTLYDMEHDYKKGKIAGYEVSESDPQVKKQTWQEIAPQLEEYKLSKRLKK